MHKTQTETYRVDWRSMYVFTYYIIFISEFILLLIQVALNKNIWHFADIKRKLWKDWDWEQKYWSHFELNFVLKYIRSEFYGSEFNEIESYEAL